MTDLFTGIEGIAAPMPAANIDTDLIFPARFLVVTDKVGLGRYAFHEWRYDASGAPIADFVLNKPAYHDARILVAGDNFGCGSSREQAPWALRDLGFRCVISSSFSEIFHANCFKSGIAPIVVDPVILSRLMADAEAARVLAIDLEGQTITRPDGAVIPFAMVDWRRQALIHGWDEIDLILRQRAGDIAAFERARRAAHPWLHREEI